MKFPAHDRSSTSLPRLTRAHRYVGIGLFAAAIATSGAAPAHPELGAASFPIIGGEVVGPCDWPAAAAVDGCSAVLVQPDLLLLAAHCIVSSGDGTSASFGSDGARPDLEVAIDACVAHPAFAAEPEGNDIAYCVLSQPAHHVPIVPVARASAVALGEWVTVVGFGAADDGGAHGLKRAVRVPVRDLGPREAFLGGDGLDSCVGDSGGPALIQSESGSWAVFALVSTGRGACGNGGDYTLIEPHLKWLELSTGRLLDPDPIVRAERARATGAPRACLESAAPNCGVYPRSMAPSRWALSGMIGFGGLLALRRRRHRVGHARAACSREQVRERSSESAARARPPPSRLLSSAGDVSGRP